VIQLPAAITVTELGMDPGNTCGDDPSATTRGYKVETSADGSTWTPAVTAQFSSTDAHRLNLVKPTSGTANVRFVRLTLMSSQSNTGSGADFIDFSEFEVYGSKPNVLPSGTVSADPAAVLTGQTVRLTAAFSDPDSAITGYDWDFDGNGTVDRSTTTATTETSYATAGSRTVKVAVKDFRGGAGTASTDVGVAVAVAAGAAKPKVTIAGSGKRFVKVTVICDSACSVKGSLKVTTKLRRKLKLKSRTVGKLTGSLTAAGTKSLRLKLSTKTRAAMKKRKLSSIRAAASVTATDAEQQKATAKRKVKIRR
jgi:PKD repeat protein